GEAEGLGSLEAWRPSRSCLRSMQRAGRGRRNWATRLHEVAHPSDCRDAIRGGESQDLVPVRHDERVGENDDGPDTSSRQPGEGSCYVDGPLHGLRAEQQTQRRRQDFDLLLNGWVGLIGRIPDDAYSRGLWHQFLNELDPLSTEVCLWTNRESRDSPPRPRET